MQELSDFNKSQNININKLQSQLDKYEKNQNKLLVELETEKEHNKEHMKTITEQDKTIKILREELETTFNDKNESEKEFNNKITQFKNKLEVSSIYYNKIKLMWCNKYFIIFRG